MSLEVGRHAGDWPSVSVVVGALVAEASREVGRTGGRTRTVGVRLGLGLVVLDPVEDRSEDLPCDIELIVTDEVRAVALDGVKNKSFVRGGDLDVGEAVLVGHVELDGDGLGHETGKLVVELDVDGLVGLDAENQLVANDVREDTRGDVLELDTDLNLALIEG